MVYQAAEARYDTMKYRRSGRSGLLLPAVSLGIWWNFGGVDQIENSRAMLRRAFDLGVTHIDIANNYGPRPARPRRPSPKYFVPTWRPTATS